MSRVFISHSSRDRDLVEREVIEPLRRHDIETWYSKDDIETAADWEKSICQGLNDCEWFLVVLTPRAVESRWVKIEVDWALDERPSFRGYFAAGDSNVGFTPINRSISYDNPIISIRRTRYPAGVVTNINR